MYLSTFMSTMQSTVSDHAHLDLRNLSTESHFHKDASPNTEWPQSRTWHLHRRKIVPVSQLLHHHHNVNYCRLRQWKNFHSSRWHLHTLLCSHKHGLIFFKEVKRKDAAYGVEGFGQSDSENHMLLRGALCCHLRCWKIAIAYAKLVAVPSIVGYGERPQSKED